MRLDGDTQISAAFLNSGDRVDVELFGTGSRANLRLDLPPASGPAGGSRVSLCLRAMPRGSHGTELQLWVWRGLELVAVESLRCEFAALEAEVRCAGDIEHLSVWSPEDASIEPPGNAYALLDELRPGAELSEAERGAEGRQIVVESGQDGEADPRDRLGPGSNRFLIKRATAVDLSSIDAYWLSGGAHGIMLTAGELVGKRLCELLIWAGWRQALVFLGGADWGSILAVALRRKGELRAPVVVVDPALSGDGPVRPLAPEVAAFAAANGHVFVLLGRESRNHSDRRDLERLPRRLLHGGPSLDDEAEMLEANETLRQLTERTMLMRLRQAYGRPPAEVGRRPAFS